VVNRGIAKRPYFEARSDKRYFLARLAAEVRAGRIEVHAFTLMTTHFHLLVSSPVGDLSGVMRRVQNAYSRYFNRRRRRDGPLIRARFFSKRVATDRYRDAVVRYIDLNAVRARIVKDAVAHEFGSARAFALDRRPPWLSADCIERRALALTGESEFSGSTYLRAFGSSGPRSDDAVVELVEARMRSAGDVDPLDDLIGQTPAQVRAWMARKAELADGHPLGLPVSGPATVARAVSQHVAGKGDWVVQTSRSAYRGSEVAHVGLLRDLVAAPLEQIGQQLDLTYGAVQRRLRLHRRLMPADEQYQERLGRLSRAALDPLV
jgi:REP element-mobilizing transposase RayT